MDKKIKIGIGIIVLVLIGWFFVGQNNNSKTTGPIKIGSLAHQTGFGSAWGEVEKNAVTMRIKELKEKGMDIQVVYEDCASDISQCVSAANKLINIDNVDVIIGPTWTEWTDVIVPIANKNNIVLLAPSASKEDSIQPYGFNLFFSAENMVDVAFRHAFEKNIKKIAQVSSPNAFFDNLNNKQKEKADDFGISIIDDYRIGSDSEMDFSTIITRIKSQESNIDALFVNLYQAQIERFVKQTIEQGVEIPIYYLSDYPVMSGIYQMKYYMATEFNNKYFKEYGTDPYPSGQTAYDAVSLIASAIKEGASNSKDIAKFLRNLEDFEGITGKITFDDNGIVNYPHDQFSIIISE